MSTSQPATSEWTCPTCGRVCASDFTVCPIDATPRTEHAHGGDPMIGEILGRTYKIARVLGQGGMARLYEAEHLRIDARYAVKVIHDDLAREPDMLARFEREARAAGRIHSDHVVTLVDVLRTSDNRPCLVTELLDGEDLQVRLDRAGKLSVADAIPIARQLCRAVADAHAVGVVHRDLKPSNVFLCPSLDGVPHVKVFDFGVAKLDGDERMTRTDAVMGTAAYMAPEQARSANDAGPLADVYSIGAVLYHMLAGVPPYGQVPALSRFALVLHEEPARPRTIESTIPAGVEAVIQHAMARDRTLRTTSPLALEAELAVFDQVAAPIVPPPIESAVPVEPAKGTDNTAPVVVPPPQPTVAPRTTKRMPRAQTQPGVTTTATDITLKANLARPIAIAIAIASSLAAGAWTAVLLGLVAGSASGGERALLAMIGIAATVGVTALHVRTLKPRWSSTPSVSSHILPYARGLVAGVTTLGGLELFSHATLALLHDELLGVGARIAIAGIAALIGLSARRLGLDERVRRKMG